MDTSTQHILTINGGSSSIKFSVFVHTNAVRVLSGKIDHIGMGNTSLSLKNHTTGEVHTQNIDAEDVILNLLETLKEHIDIASLVAVGHRVAHGGSLYQAPTRITENVLADLESIISFAPRHLPQEIALIRACMAILPRTPHIACFDTSFFKDIPKIAQLLPVPRRYHEHGVRRYGFHGLSYEFLMHELKDVLGIVVEEKKIILAHLGSGASLTAIHQGKPIETTMGFTPNSGIPMGTRTGDIDPGFFEYCVHAEGMSMEDFGHMVHDESGYLGISEISADMEVLLARASADARAEEAVAHFCYHVRKEIGALATTMGGIDILVFTGGMGEKSSPIRKRICEGLEFLGITIDEVANTEHKMDISDAQNRAKIYVIPTNEELMIAHHVSEVLL